MSFEEPLEVKNWKKERVLGSGGFGTVTLWKNKNGDQMIALKKCRFGADSLLTAKQKERWKKEVEIMQRLKHPNVVRALQLPDDLANLPSILPILCMEYCSKGDLRQMLNRPENSCGLPESDVRRLIQNVASAVSYLHSEKITHRDLKPENIVLSQDDSGVIYKLIDLGYAKELDSSCTSFVGTLQYLAPELFTNEKYSSSVDYWSLGLVSHEVITGIRPFLPSLAPVAWMKEVKRKSPEHICAYQTRNGKIEFRSHLFPENQISSVLRKDMEQWLKLVLEWDPLKRGRNSEGQIIVFSEIESILSKKVVRVFCMVTYKRLSYSIDDSTSLSVLRDWIEKDTKIPVKEQELLLASGQQLNVDGSIEQCLNSTSQESLFVCKRGVLELPTSVSPNLPELVANMLQSPREKMEYVFLRRAYSHAAYFMLQENKLYKTYLLGCKLKLLSVVLRCQKVVRESQKVSDQSNSVTAFRELCIDAFKFDCSQAKKAQISYILSGWQQQIDVLNGKHTELHGKTSFLTSEAQRVTKLARKLQSAQPCNMKEDSILSSFMESGLELLDKLRRRPTSERSSSHDSLDMVKVLYNFLKQRDCLLHNQALNGHLKQLIDCECELMKLMPKLEEMTHKLTVLKLDIIKTNRDRQRSVWDLLSSSLGDGESPAGGFPLSSNRPFSSPDTRSSPFLYRSQSSRSLYTEEHPPPVPPHGVSPCVPAAASFSLFNPYSPSISQSSLLNASKATHPVFDLSDLQQPMKDLHLSNGNDSGIGCGWTKGSTLSLSKPSGDNDLTLSMINENVSLRMQTQELLENCSQFRKALSADDNTFDWSFLKADTH